MGSLHRLLDVLMQKAPVARSWNAGVAGATGGQRFSHILFLVIRSSIIEGKVRLRGLNGRIFDEKSALRRGVAVRVDL